MSGGAMATITERFGGYEEALSERLAESGAPGRRWLKNLREGAYSQFVEKGFPTTHDEDWRFTNVSSIAQTPYVLAAKNAAVVSESEAAPYRLEDSACQLVFVDGWYQPTLSRVDSLPRGLEVSSLAAAIQDAPDSVRDQLGHYLSRRMDAFGALNTALFGDGALIRIGHGALIEKPISLLYLTSSGDFPLMNHPRNLVIAERGSQAAVVEDYVSFGDGATFSNSITELVADEEAVVSHYLIEREGARAANVSTLRIEQARASNVTSHSVLVGGNLVRNNVHPVLAGRGAECLINGLFIGNGQQHLDNYMLVEHVGQFCSSRQFYNGILDDHARGVFHGRIIVHKDAQRTDAKQTNRNLLLCDDARVDTKPQLEIYADDVKCTHGATIGQLDENQLFYLQARGIGEDAARRVLLYAFAGECLQRMADKSVREKISRLIHKRLASPSLADLTEGEHSLEELK